METKLFKVLFVFLIFSQVFFACNTDDEIEKGKFPINPVNFEDINSEYDDFNSNIPLELSSTFPIVFSTNRLTSGDNFDFINYVVQYNYNTSSNEFYFDTLTDEYWFYDSAFELMNTDDNELGPLVVNDYNSNVIFLYSSDALGNLDIYYTWCNNFTPWQSPALLKSVNSNFNDGYQTFNDNASRMYFCSDSTGNFEIYYVQTQGSASIYNWVQSSTKLPWTNQTNLNSSSDDKCPYINNKLLVFTSNREGGYGGFDLYYSRYSDGDWSNPINFGPGINTEYDEYRPLTAFSYFYKNDLLIFSSNRPGGKGGFDLYYVGIPKMIE